MLLSISAAVLSMGGYIQMDPAEDRKRGLFRTWSHLTTLLRSRETEGERDGGREKFPGVGKIARTMQRAVAAAAFEAEFLH